MTIIFAMDATVVNFSVNSVFSDGESFTGDNDKVQNTWGWYYI